MDTPLPVSVEHPIETDFVATPVVASVVDSTAANSSFQQQHQHATCTVFAPATLQAGYSFPCRVDGIDFMVIVPDGGVTEGQAFKVPYPTNRPVVAVSTAGAANMTSGVAVEAISSHNHVHIPTGKWRNDICDCFEVCHMGLFWQGWCCTPLLLGQIMTRSKLNPLGSPVPDESYRSTCYVIAGLWIGFVILLLFIRVFVDISSVLLIWPFIMTFIAGNTRYSLRQRYQIPVKCCHAFGGLCDDWCCAFWCACCVTIQMARHTHPTNRVDEYPYSCCSTTGFPPGAPDIV